MPMISAARNPFRTSRLEALDFRPPAGESWDSLLDRLAALDHRAAVVGPHGSGKTTLLEQLRARLIARGLRVRSAWLTLDSPLPSAADLTTAFADVARDEVVLFDGASHLPWRRRALLRRLTRAGGLVTTAHRAWPGGLPVLLRTATSSELLAELVRELDADCRVDCHALHRVHGGDLRAALLALYDRAAGRRKATSPA